MERKRQPIKRETPQPELDLNKAFFRTFSSRDGEQVLNYLRGAFIFEILPASATADELRYREGARSVVALIEIRKAQA